jgi:tetratricopeptide (TPR) repeat protein
VDTSLELPGQVTKGLRLWIAVQRHIVVRGLFKEAREHGDKLLAHPETAPRDAIRAHGLAAAGYLAWVADDMADTHLRHTEALAISRELDDARGVAQALANLALHAIDCGEVSLARTHVAEAIALIASLPDLRVTAHVKHIRAVLAAEEGDFGLALAWEEESLALYRKAGDLWHSMIIAWCVGVNAMALGHLDRARELLAGCLQTGLDLGNYWGTTYPLDAFATLAVAEGRYERAARIFGASEAQRTRLGIFPQPPEHQALRAVMSAATDFGGPVAEAARRQGRELRFDAAVALALERG